MFFGSLQNKIAGNTWIKFNIRYFLVGILIGTFLNIIFFLLGNLQYRNWSSILITYVVSIIITLAITNISYISSGIIKKKYSSPLINIGYFYLLIILGTFIGSELSFLFISLITNKSFFEIDQAGNLKFNLIIGFLAGTIIYIYQLQRDNYNIKIQQKEIELLKLNEKKTQAELQTLQATINPHFLYNALNSITSLIHDEPDKAEEMILKLAKLFRYSINTQHSNWSTVKEELDIVKTYLDIERVRFGSRIEFTINSDISIQELMIPRFLIQPLVENALKHGLKNIRQNGILKVFVGKQKDYLEISVEDNGIPFPEDMLIGYGLQSTDDKLKLLYKNAARLYFLNAPEKKIVVEVPLRK